MSQISAKKEKAIIALLQNPTVRDAAEQLQIAERTLWRWLQEDPFRECYLRARREAFSQAMNLLQQYLGEAVMVLREVMNNQESSDSSKVNAAKAIIETGFKAVELVDLENRITELEEMAHKTRRNSY
jgi:hypothetical protein